MTRSMTRTGLILTTLFTTVVHLIVLNYLALTGDDPHIDPLFTLNGLGYAALLFLAVRPPAFLNVYRSLTNWLLMLYAGATIVAFFLFDGPGQSTAMLGWVTKFDEVLLMYFAWKNTKQEA